MSRVFYLGYYSCGGKERISSPAAVTMMDYVIGSIHEAGYMLSVISPAQGNGECFQRKEFATLGEDCECVFLPSYKRRKKRGIITRAYQKILRERDLQETLSQMISDGDTLIVYHSLALIDAVRWLRRRKKIRIILQVCEIYTDVVRSRIIEKKRELSFFNIADAYIFSSDLLEKKINKYNKKFAVCYGTYKKIEKTVKKWDDGKIHAVYAGTFDPRKGGVAAAAAAAAELSEDYHIHILGFGTEYETEQLKKTICDISKDSKAKVTYDGLLSGEEYIRFLQSCDVGLSTQMPDAAFNETSFPSKVLSYLANGLRVVSVRIKALEQSAISDLLYYYDENTPAAIAEAVKKIDFSQPYDSRAVIGELDEKFMKEIKALISKV